MIDVNTLFGPLPAAATDLSVDDLSVLMKKHQITACCTLSTIGMLLDYNTGNAATRAACSENGSLVPVATVNPRMYFGGDAQASHFTGDGFKIVRFFPEEQGWEIDSAPFHALLQAMSSNPLPIMVDIARPGIASRAAQATARHLAPLILSGVDEKTLSEAVAIMRSRANVYVETSRLVATGALKFLVECVGADRVLYGSGAPLRPMASAVGTLQHSGLTPEQQALVAGGNARALLEIK